MFGRPVSGVQRYLIRFADGRTATVLDMNGDPPADFIAWLSAYFRPGFVLEAVHVP